MCKSSLAQGVEKVEPYSVFAPALPVVVCANMPGEMFTEACLCIPDSTRCSYTDKICVHTLTTNCSGTASTHTSTHIDSVKRVYGTRSKINQFTL